MGNGWRCVHQNITVPTGAPEMLAMHDNASICIQWPTIVHAGSYIVELLNQNTMMAQQFVHAMPSGIAPPLMTLHVGGLKPGHYAACVRCVAPCGCESPSSPWSFSQLCSAPPPEPRLFAP